MAHNTNCVAITPQITCPAPSAWADCRPWSLTNDKVNCYMDRLIDEGLSIAGAPVNIYKLLGVHEQTQLVNLAVNGSAISGGDRTGYPASNAFTTLKTEWQSKQTGSQAVLASAYIGYDFGEIKVPTGRQRYGIDASVRHQVTAIKIKQSSNAANRVTKVRVERSENGTEWYGVAILELPNNDRLNSFSFRDSVPNRYWRLRPLAFTGDSCDSWGVQALELHEYTVTNYDNIQDKIFMENRNRDYCTSPVTMKAYYDLAPKETDILKFASAILPQQTQFKLSFSRCLASLGRPVIVGDIIEVPNEAMYTPDLQQRKLYLEVTQVAWDPSTATPGWQYLMLLVTAVPALASEETQDIFGDLAKNVDQSGLFDNDDGNAACFQDFSNVAQTIDQEAKTATPERGSEGSSTFREFTEQELETADDNGFPHINKIGFNRTGLYVEDAMPQNNAPYTEGPELPTSPNDGDYHRLVYVGLSKDVPARLYRYSTTKGRWVYLETDRREQYNNQKAILDEYLMSTMKKPPQEIK